MPWLFTLCVIIMKITLKTEIESYFHLGFDNCGDHTEICDILILGVIIVGITLILEYQYSCWSKKENLCFHFKFIFLWEKIPPKNIGNSLKTSAMCNNQNIHKRKWIKLGAIAPRLIFSWIPISSCGYWVINNLFCW